VPEAAESSVDRTGTHYSRAPILEAVIDVHVRLPAETSTEDLGSIAWDEGGHYSVRLPRFRGDFRLQANAQEPVVSATQTQIGFVFRDDRRKQVVQARLDGFAFSKLAPYESWEPFCQEARALWKRYCEVARPLDVTRIAVRYINRLDLPLPFGDFREYLRTSPEVSPDLPQGLSAFLLQLQIPQEDIPDGMLILNEGLMESSGPEVASILLDIDLFRAVVLPTTGDAIWDALEVLHRRKNAVFEACITNRTRELIR
jgi:uncharacterized protein (TIGR04255 family)